MPTNKKPMPSTHLKLSKTFRPQSNLFAVEPRMLFDGAAAAAVDATPIAHAAPAFAEVSEAHGQPAPVQINRTPGFAPEARPDEYFIDAATSISDGKAVAGDQNPATPWHDDAQDNGDDLHVTG